MPQIIMDEITTPKQFSSEFNNDYAKCPNCKREILEKTLVEPA
jgi:hypothetical protein